MVADGALSYSSMVIEIRHNGGPPPSIAKLCLNSHEAERNQNDLCLSERHTHLGLLCQVQNCIRVYNTHVEYEGWEIITQYPQALTAGKRVFLRLQS